MQGITLMDFAVVPSGSVPLSANSGEANAIEKPVADLIGVVSPSHPSAPQVLNAPFLVGIDDDKSLAVGKGPLSSGVARRAAAARRFSLLPYLPKQSPLALHALPTNQPSPADTFSRTAKSTSTPKSVSGDIKRSGSRKKIEVKRGSRAIEKVNKTGCRSEVFPSLRRQKSRFGSVSLQFQRLERLPMPCFLVTPPM